MWLILLLGIVQAGFLAAQTPTAAGCPALPLSNVWNSPVNTLPVDSNSATYINTIGASIGLHPDFGSGTYNGGPIGIPFTTVPGNQPKVPITFEYDEDSDPGPYPIPPNPPIEGGSGSSGDRHVLIVDRDNCILYEIFSAYPQAGGSWTAGSGAKFDLRSNALRPATFTSADAAGLPILPGLVRYDEIAAGQINHAIRFTAPSTRRAFIWPARHYASTLTGTQYPPMGQRFRLRSSFNIANFAPQVRVILTALQKYGMILADNGSAWYLSGVPDERFDNDILRQLSMVKGSDFEAIDESGIQLSADSGGTVVPTAESVSPSSGSGASQIFTFKYGDLNGYSDLNFGLALFQSQLVASNACYVIYNRPAAAFYLINDAGTVALGPVAPGSSGTVENSQCLLSGTGSSAAGSGNILTLNISLTFKVSFTGPKTIFVDAIDAAGHTSDMQPRGAWTVNSANPPVSISATPNAGSGASQVFRFDYSDLDGSADLNVAYALFNSTLYGVNACYVYYYRLGNGLYLVNDANTAVMGPVAAGSTTSVQNSQCVLSGSGSSWMESGNILRMNVSLTFKPAFSGTKTIFLNAVDRGGRNSGWQSMGTWAVP